MVTRRVNNLDFPRVVWWSHSTERTEGKGLKMLRMAELWESDRRNNVVIVCDNRQQVWFLLAKHSREGSRGCWHGSREGMCVRVGSGCEGVEKGTLMLLYNNYDHYTLSFQSKTFISNALCASQRVWPAIMTTCFSIKLWWVTWLQRHKRVTMTSSWEAVDNYNLAVNIF